MTSHKAWRNMQKSIFEPLTWKCNWKLSCTESDFKLRLQKVSNTSTKPACARRMWSVWNIEKWPDGYIIFSKLGHLEQSKIAQTYKIFAKVGSQFCQILNSYSRNGQKLFKILPKWQNFAKSGHTTCLRPLPCMFEAIINWLQQARHNPFKHFSRSANRPFSRKAFAEKGCFCRNDGMGFLPGAKTSLWASLKAPSHRAYYAA